jgi:hypothetical protein
MSTVGRTPRWPGPHDRPRVLVEVPGARWHAGNAAVDAGIQVLACPGPTGSHTRCPALRGERCPLVDGADVVVMSCSRPDGRWDALRAAHAEHHPDVPILVEHAVPPPGTIAVPADLDAPAVAVFVRDHARPRVPAATVFAPGDSIPQAPVLRGASLVAQRLGGRRPGGAQGR